MNADELKVAGRKLYGYGWQTRLAKELGVDGSTVRRWVSGAIPVPGPAAAAVECFLRNSLLPSGTDIATQGIVEPLRR